MVLAKSHKIAWAMTIFVFSTVVRADYVLTDEEKKVAELVATMGGGLWVRHPIPGNPEIEIHLGKARFTDKEVKAIAPLRNVKGLHLDSTEVTAAAWKEFSSLAFVESVRIWNDVVITETEIEHLGSMASLRALSIQTCHDLSPEAWRSLRRLSKLNEFSAPQIPIEGWRSLMALELTALRGEPPDGDLNGLSKQKKLRRLELPGVDFLTDRGFNEIGKLGQLTELDLRDTDLSEVAFKYIAKLRKLESLHFTDTEISDASAGFIGELKDLKMASLEGCRFSDKVVLSISCLPKIENLTLNRTNINDNHLNVLGQAARLRHLSLIGTETSEDARQLLRIRLPKCYVLPLAPDEK